MSTIFTIGYEGTDIDRFIETLQIVGIDVVVDVRAVPLSRKKGFSKKALQEHLGRVGIEYLPMQRLGDPKPGREAAKAGDYNIFRSIYTNYVSQPQQMEAVMELVRFAAQKTICLLCFERDPKMCHRLIVAEQMEAYGCEYFHLYADDPTRYLRHQVRIAK
ncbi:DUF488 family protein [Camelimonas abortus]|uniref:DUF488 family protein n=1 Tax=Camelimonas abortus TaxID=1017184 RepID=A0ABV7LBT7_9HYPH